MVPSTEHSFISLNDNKQDSFAHQLLNHEALAIIVFIVPNIQITDLLLLSFRFITINRERMSFQNHIRADFSCPLLRAQQTTPQ